MARILVIEDNRDNLTLMTYLLEAFGHSVRKAEDGEAGLAAVARELPDLVVCDIHLPKVDGYEVARRLKSGPQFRRLPLVAVSALAMVGDRERGLAAGFDGYIAKPIDPEAFVSEVELFLQAEQRGEAPEQRAGAGGSGADRPSPWLGTVLVVDDSLVNRELIRDTLEPCGYRVVLARSVGEAMALASQSVPDLILSDLRMPGEDGFHLVRRVKAHPRLAVIPVLFISSSVWGEMEREEALSLGVSRFLLRPIEPQRLLAEIASCLMDHGESHHGDDPDRR